MSLESDFGTFWLTYPRRTGKLAAEKAYRKARMIASAEQILDGVTAYRENKPAYADWCMPTTFLNQGRWMDEPDRQPHEPWDCPHEPHCLGRSACAVLKRLGR